MTTYDRNRNAITTGSRVMVSGTGHTGKILSIDTEGRPLSKSAAEKP